MLSHRLPSVLLVATLVVVGGHRPTFARHGVPTDACALLTKEQVSAALEVTSLAGRHPFASITTSCIWSDDADASISNRRVTLSILRPRGFDMPRSGGAMKTAPASGVGDDAYYVLYGSASPQLMVRKGDAQFSVRVLNGLKFKPFTLDEEKAKEMALAQAAVKAL